MKNLVYLLSIAFISVSASAQSTLNASGGTNVLNGNTHSYSIGEMTLVHTAEAGNIIVTQGILQSMPTAVGIADLTLSSDELKVYPNPADNEVHLQLNLEKPGDLTVHFFDIMGRQLIRKEYKINSGKEKHSLNLQGLAAGNYLLRAEFRDGQAIAVQSFKIQKVH